MWIKQGHLVKNAFLQTENLPVDTFPAAPFAAAAAPSVYHTERQEGW